MHPFGLLIRQPVPRCACLFAPSPPQAGAGPDPLFRPVVRVPAFLRGQYGASQVPRRAIPWLCRRSLTPDDPLRLAYSGASSAAPALIRTKASTLRISRLNSVASTTRCVRFTTYVAARHATLAPGWRAAPLPGRCQTCWLAVQGFSSFASSLPGLTLTHCNSLVFS